MEVWATTTCQASRWSGSRRKRFFTPIFCTKSDLLKIFVIFQQLELVLKNSPVVSAQKQKKKSRNIGGAAGSKWRLKLVKSDIDFSKINKHPTYYIQQRAKVWKHLKIFRNMSAIPHRVDQIECPLACRLAHEYTICMPISG